MMMNMDMKRYKFEIWCKNDLLRTICRHKKKKGGRVGEGGDFAEFEILPFEQGYRILYNLPSFYVQFDTSFICPLHFAWLIKSKNKTTYF
jgi:hypothetical protein